VRNPRYVAVDPGKAVAGVYDATDQALRIQDMVIMAGAQDIDDAIDPVFVQKRLKNNKPTSGEINHAA
jgi:hypothetical protein